MLAFNKPYGYKYRYAFNLIPTLFEDISENNKHIQSLINFKRLAVINFSSNKNIDTIVQFFNKILTVYKDFYMKVMKVYVEKKTEYYEKIDFDIDKRFKLCYYIYNLIENHNLILLYLKQEIKTNFIDRDDLLDVSNINNYERDGRKEFIAYVKQMTKIGEKFKKSLTAKENEIITTLRNMIKEIKTNKDTEEKKFKELNYNTYLEFLPMYAIKPIYIIILGKQQLMCEHSNYKIDTSIIMDIHEEIYEKLRAYFREEYIDKMKSFEAELIQLLIRKSKTINKSITEKTTEIINYYESLTGNTDVNNTIAKFYEFYGLGEDFNENMKNSNSVYALALIVNTIIDNLSLYQDEKECKLKMIEGITPNIDFILDENIRNNLRNDYNIQTVIETKSIAPLFVNREIHNSLKSSVKKASNKSLQQRKLQQKRKKGDDMKGGNLNNNIITIISIIVLIVVIVIVVVLVIKYIKKKEELRNEVVNSN